MDYFVSYRDTEITAKVNARNQTEAVEKFLCGKVEDVEVDFGALHPCFVEVEEAAEAEGSEEDNHDCEDYRVANCDGEFHTNFCSKCNKDLGTTNCDG